MIVASLRLMGTVCFFDNWISWICAGYARMYTEGESELKVKQVVRHKGLEKGKWRTES